jgi:uncharacterized protein GlcG (DUF336 family)
MPILRIIGALGVMGATGQVDIVVALHTMVEVDTEVVDMEGAAMEGAAMEGAAMEGIRDTESPTS